jgi:uncharacterized protein (DUF58 family)
VSGGRPTRDGAIAVAGGIALLVVGALSGNNLLYLVAAPIWAILLLAVPLGWWNLRGLQIRRVLPTELYAGREAAGRLLVRNPRRRLRARAIVVVDEGTGAVGAVAHVDTGGIAELAVRWRFGERGPTRLTAVLLSSRWPFGLAEHQVRLPLAADLVVYPRPLPASSRPLWGSGLGAEEEGQGHGTGEFLGLRACRTGDPPRTVHWPTTARMGTLYVVERAGETERAVEVEVRPATGTSWERELSRATGEIHRALQLGRKVGLVLPAVGEQPARALPPSVGGTWRRTLLEALALLPRVP